MKDAYSFDSTEEGLKKSYLLMEKTYHRIFERCGFNFIEVEADPGAIGGSGSAEFIALTEYGEDTVLFCKHCHYGGNQEKASAYFPPYPKEPMKDLLKIPTPNIRTVEELVQFIGFKPEQMVKTIVMNADGKPIIVSMRGDLEISEVKIANLLRASNVVTADYDLVEEVTGAPVGFAGPINLFGKTKVPYYFDKSVKGLRNFLCGANKKDIHYIEVNTGRDFPAPPEYFDLSKATAGSFCPNCQNYPLKVYRGIELGHVFQLQQNYSSLMKATFLNKEGQKNNFWMGCYGIGVSRIVQAAVEQFHDERGIVWPVNLAPFEVVIIPINVDNHLTPSLEIYKKFQEEGFKVILDDRDLRTGEKLTDAELLGWPVQIIIGRSWDSEKKLEVRWRNVKNFDKNVFQFKDSKTLPTCITDLVSIITFLKQCFRR